MDEAVFSRFLLKTWINNHEWVFRYQGSHLFFGYETKCDELKPLLIDFRYTVL